MGCTCKSPLRYPGGKARLAPLLNDILHLNGMQGGTYLEPYAGGAGAALELLFKEQVSRIIINDLDPAIYAFWNSLCKRPGHFLKYFEQTSVSMQEWYKQKKVYEHPKTHSSVKLGFSTFFLNRCNRSGILKQAGPIGGYNQEGRWKLDARFNKVQLRERLNRIVEYRDRITVLNMDAHFLLRNARKYVQKEEPLFVFLDPPYYKNGQKLYLNSYNHSDHTHLANFLKKSATFKWVMTYDDVPEINEIYTEFQKAPFNITHHAYKVRQGKELVISHPSLILPETIIV